MENEDWIFQVIYYFIIICVLGILYFFFKPIRPLLLIVIAVTWVIFLISLVVSMVGVLARRRRLIGLLAEKQLIPTDPEKKPASARDPNEVISYGEKEKESGICGRCGGRLVLRTAKYGGFKGRQFYGCSNFPKCKNLIPGPRQMTDVLENKSDIPVCSRCGAKMVIRTSRRGKSKGNKFYGCSNFPSCRNTFRL